MENGEEDTFQTRERCVPHETTSGGIWGRQEVAENNPGAGARRGQWAGAKLVKVRTAVSSRRRSLDLTLKGWERREPCIC